MLGAPVVGVMVGASVSVGAVQLSMYTRGSMQTYVSKVSTRRHVGMVTCLPKLGLADGRGDGGGVGDSVGHALKTGPYSKFAKKIKNHEKVDFSTPTPRGTPPWETHYAQDVPAGGPVNPEGT